MSKMLKNVLLLCADELRGDCLGYMGNPDIKTPYLDELAKESVVFERCMTVFPKCMPARASLMTGRYCHTGAWRTVGHQHLPSHQVTLLERFKENGYETAVFGKNHCWDPEVFKESVDYRSSSPPFGEMTKGVPKIRQHVPNPDGAVPLDLGKGWDYIGCNTRFASDEVKAEQAIEYLRHRRDRSRPFFLQVNIEAPHPVYGVEEPYFSMYNRKSIQGWPFQLPRNAPLPMLKQREFRTGLNDHEASAREVQCVYYGMISKVDFLMGKILQAVKAECLEEDTMVIFWSDHGDYAGQYGLVEKWDTSFPDCLMHVPLLIKAPGLPAGLRLNGLADTTDLAPTICEWLGLEKLPGMHGRSLLPAIQGGPMRQAVFADGGHEVELMQRAPAELLALSEGTPSHKTMTYVRCPDAMARAKMIRTDRYKMVIRLTGGNELYDLQTDHWEMDNRWGDPALNHVLPDLMGQMLEWCLQTDPQEPILSKFTV